MTRTTINVTTGSGARMSGRLECGLDRFTQTLGRFSSGVTGTVRLCGREVERYVVKSATQKFRPAASSLPRHVDNLRAGRHFAKVPTTDLSRCASRMVLTT